jgi:hypothetical protein
MERAGGEGNPPGVTGDQVKVRGVNVLFPALRPDTCSAQRAVMLALQPLLVLLLCPALGVAAEYVGDGHGASTGQLGREDSIARGSLYSVGENIKVRPERDVEVVQALPDVGAWQRAGSRPP